METSSPITLDALKELVNEIAEQKAQQAISTALGGGGF